MRKLWIVLAVILISVNANADILSVAHKYIGKGEGDKEYRLFLGGREGLPWCAGFVSYVLREAGYKYKYTLRAKECLSFGSIVKRPKPGDIIYFYRSHVGIVESLVGDKLTTIEGNTGDHPRKVRRKVYRLSDMKKLATFVRLERR